MGGQLAGRFVQFFLNLIFYFSPNSFPAIGVLAGLVEGRWWDPAPGQLPGERRAAESRPDLLLFT